MNEKDFTRNRVLTFPILILYFINLAKKSLQVSINSFFKLILHSPVSKQAFSKARSKISPETFRLLNKKLIEEYYTDNDFPTWNGFRLLAVDGSSFQYPQKETLKTIFGTMKNQHGAVLGMATLSHAYDVLRGLVLDTKIGICKGAERDLFVKHVEEIDSLKQDKTDDLYILDRGYPSLGLLFYLKSKKKNFVMRCKTSKCFSEIKKVIDSGKQDAIISMYARDGSDKQLAEIKKRAPTLDLKETYVEVRVILVLLETGEKELLITSLLSEKHPHSIFKGLYFKRWGAEENYKWQKQVLELENFSGHSKLSVEQDVFSLVLTANLTSLLMNEAQNELQKEDRQYKHEVKINKRMAVSALRDELVKVLFDKNVDFVAFCERLKEEFKKYLCPVRPNRTYKRPRKGRLKFGLTTRPCI